MNVRNRRPELTTFFFFASRIILLQLMKRYVGWKILQWLRDLISAHVLPCLGGCRLREDARGDTVELLRLRGVDMAEDAEGVGKHCPESAPGKP